MEEKTTGQDEPSATTSQVDADTPRPSAARRDDPAELTTHDAGRVASETTRRRAAEAHLADALERSAADRSEAEGEDALDSGERTYGTPDDPQFSAG